MVGHRSSRPRSKEPGRGLALWFSVMDEGARRIPPGATPAGVGVREPLVILSTEDGPGQKSGPTLGS